MDQAQKTSRQRRAGKGVGATVQLSGSMVFKGRKEDFVSDNDNKQRFITLISDLLERHRCLTQHARADADLLIVQTAVDASERMPKPTSLVADVTDILILLCFHSKPTTPTIYLRPEPRHDMKRIPRCCNIAALRAILDHQVCRNILCA